MISKAQVRTVTSCIVISIGFYMVNPVRASHGTLYTAGHADIGVQYSNGEFDLHYRFGADAVLNGSVLGVTTIIDPDEITTIVEPKFTFPAGSPVLDSVFGISGASQDVWVLPQSRTTGVPFLGFPATNTLTAADWDGGITFQVMSMSGSGVDNGGQFGIWRTGTAGEITPIVTSYDGFSAADSVLRSIPGHSHSNFGFTAAGIYDVVFKAFGNHKTDGFKETVATYRFQVVPEPSSVALLLIGAGVVAITRRRYRTRSGSSLA